MYIIDGKILKFENGENGIQPALIVLGTDNHVHIITASIDRRFIVSDEGPINNMYCPNEE